MDQWLMVIRPARPEMLTDGPNEVEWELIGQHFEFWQQISAKGLALVVGRTQTNGPETLGLAIFLAPDEAGAHQLVNADPAVKGGVFRAEIHRYKVAILGNGAGFAP